MKVDLKLTQLFVALSSLIAIAVSHNNLARITGLVGSSYRQPNPPPILLRLVSGFDGRNLLNLNAKHQSQRKTNNGCHPNPCNGDNTNCYKNVLGNPQCVCKPGFVSSLDSPLYGCVSDPCNNNRCRTPHTVCYANNSTSYECVCEPGYRPVRQSIEDYGCELASCNDDPMRGDVKVTCSGCSYDDEVSFDSICAETVDRNGEVGTIQSPGYPDDYANDICVTWRLEAPECSRLQIEITDMDIDGDLDEECDDDFLRVSYGNTPYGFSRTKICTESGEMPYLITSPSNYMELNLVTSSAGTYRGFKLNYKYILE